MTDNENVEIAIEDNVEVEEVKETQPKHLSLIHISEPTRPY